MRPGAGKDRLSLGRQWPTALLVAVCVLYLPFLWILLIDYPWDGYRFFWLKLWLILPGLLAGLPFHPNDFREFTAMGVATLLLVGLVTWLGSFKRSWLLVLAVLALALESYTSMLAYHLFRW